MSEHMGGPRRDDSPGSSVKSRSSRTDTSIGGVYDDPAQLTLDDLEVARRRRDRGLAVATYATDVAWTAAADRAIRELAAEGEPFTAEELRAVVGPPVGSHNAMGPRFMAAARAGIIRRVGSRQATRPEASGRWLAVWRGVV